MRILPSVISVGLPQYDLFACGLKASPGVLDIYFPLELVKSGIHMEKHPAKVVTENYLDEEMDDYLAKPFDPVTFAAVLSKVATGQFD